MGNDCPRNKKGDYDLPVSYGIECSLSFQKKYMPVSLSSKDFYDIFDSSDIDDCFYESYEVFGIWGHRIGGYPTFT